MKTILQSEAAECGLACLAMVADYHGYKTDLNSLRQRYTQSLKGVNLQQLINVADELKLTSRALKLELNQISHLKLPCILHWDLNHFVVLKSVSRRSVVILDPALGKRTLKLEQVSDRFTGIALELMPTQDFNQEDVRIKLKISYLLKSAKGLKPLLFQLFALSSILQIFALASPYYMQLVLDEVIVAYDRNLLTVLAFGFGMMALFHVFITALRGYVVIHLSSSLNQQLAFNLFRHLMRLPLDYFSKRNMGDVLSRFGSLHEVRDLLTNSMVEAIVDGIMSIATLTMIFLYSPKLALIVTLAMLLYLVIRLLWYRPLRSMSEEAIIAEAKENTNFMENVRGIQTIKLFGIEAKRQALWQNYYTEALNLDVKVERLNILYGIANRLLFGVENILVVYFGALLVIESNANQTFTAGMLMAFMAYKLQLTERFTSLVDKLIEFKMLGLHLERIADIALTQQEENLYSINHHTLEGQVSLDKVSYRYAPGEPWLFKNVSANIRAGDSVAIVGPSGCGKTTLLKIIMGLFQASEGRVLVDNIDTRRLGQQEYRRQIAAVMQLDELLSGSIAENISQFDPQIDMDRIVECAVLAEIHQDIIEMPMQYNSLVGDMGTTLSGGQKQRVLLARALYRRPKLLFLDEATSHLDVSSERKINQVLKTLQITQIVIAHRPETIRAADRILLLKDGDLVAISHEEATAITDKTVCSNKEVTTV